jgi:hypothetical protein
MQLKNKEPLRWAISIDSSAALFNKLRAGLGVTSLGFVRVSLFFSVSSVSSVAI